MYDKVVVDVKHKQDVYQYNMSICVAVDAAVKTGEQQTKIQVNMYFVFSLKSRIVCTAEREYNLFTLFLNHFQDLLPRSPSIMWRISVLTLTAVAS